MNNRIDELENQYSDLLKSGEGDAKGFVEHVKSTISKIRDADDVKEFEKILLTEKLIDLLEEHLSGFDRYRLELEKLNINGAFDLL